MIFLKKPYIKSSKAKTRLVFDVEIDDNKKKFGLKWKMNIKRYLTSITSIKIKTNIMSGYIMRIYIMK